MVRCHARKACEVTMQGALSTDASSNNSERLHWPGGPLKHEGCATSARPAANLPRAVQSCDWRCSKLLLTIDSRCSPPAQREVDCGRRPG